MNRKGCIHELLELAESTDPLSDVTYVNDVQRADGLAGKGLSRSETHSHPASDPVRLFANEVVAIDHVEID